MNACRQGVLLSVFAACASPPPAADADTAAPTNACPVDPSAFVDLRIQTTDVATVLEVTWTDPEGRAGAVEYTLADGSRRRVPTAQANTEHRALLLGLHHAQEVTLQPQALAADGAVCGAPSTTETGQLDPRFPQLSKERIEGGLLEGGAIATPVLGLDAAWVTVIDASGSPVWVWDAASALPTLGGRPLFRVEAAPDGSGLLFNTLASDVDAPSPLYRVTWDGQLSEVAVVPGGHTDFALLPGGGFVTLGWDLRETEGRQILGDTVVRVDADGSQTVLWSTFDTFTPDLSRDYSRGLLAENPDAEDWSHANAVTHDAATDSVLVAVPVAEAIVRLDAVTGDVDWVLGNTGSGADLTGYRVVSQPHSVDVAQGSIVLFNRQDFTSADECSEVIDLLVDEDAGTVGRVNAYTGLGCEQVTFLGSAERLDNGATVVAWSSAGLLDVASAERETVWRVQTSLGNAFGFATWLPGLGPELD